MKQKIIDKAKELGFSECGFASYRLMDSELEHYKSWLSSGYNADMDWMERNLEARLDVRKLLPSAKTVIVLAHSYNTQINPIANENKAKIARYAWGKDYHNVLKKKLKQLELYLKVLDSLAESRSFTDSAPIFERDWAISAGLGWRAKNSLVINRKLGSYFFISTIITNLELEADNPFGKDYCGTCTKCIDACPTGAIEQGSVVNANKCISFWTIESKSETIPENIAQNMNSWAFGCDICQEVCPWNNSRVQPTLENMFYPRNGENYIDINKVNSMTEEEFNLRYEVSPVKRTKLTGLKRNLKAIANNQK